MDARMLDELIEDIAGDVCALTVHAANECGARVPCIPSNLTPEPSLPDRLALLIYAVRSLRCSGCSAFASHGPLCGACAGTVDNAELRK